MMSQPDEHRATPKRVNGGSSVSAARRQMLITGTFRNAGQAGANISGSLSHRRLIFARLEALICAHRPAPAAPAPTTGKDINI